MQKKTKDFNIYHLYNDGNLLKIQYLFHFFSNDAESTTKYIENPAIDRQRTQIKNYKKILCDLRVLRGKTFYFIMMSENNRILLFIL